MEGPPVRLIAQKLATFKNKRVLKASGNAKIEKEQTQGRVIEDIFPRGKNLFIQFPDFSLKIHFLMFGSYRINGDKHGASPRLSLICSDGTVNFYNSSVKIITNDDVEKLYPEELDIISPHWNPAKALHLTSQVQEQMVCDVLLDQNIFAGVGNIIKNEALFMAQIHPLSRVERIPEAQLQRLVSETRVFSLLFYDVVKQGDRLTPYLRIYRRRQCPLCESKVAMKKTGERHRMSSFCPSCQVLYQ